MQHEFRPLTWNFTQCGPNFTSCSPFTNCTGFRSSDSDKINAGKTTLQVFERAPITLIFLLHSHEHQKSINRPRRLIINDNHSIHHKYMHMQIDISDTPPGIPQLKVNPREIYIHSLKKKNQPASAIPEVPNPIPAPLITRESMMSNVRFIFIIHQRNIPYWKLFPGVNKRARYSIDETLPQ